MNGVIHIDTQSIPDRMAALSREFASCRKAFIALGDENRQHIVIALLENCGGMRVGEITKRTNLSRPAVSHHLKILKDAGMVSMFKQGTMNFYHVEANETQWGMLAALMEHINNLVKDVSEKQKTGERCHVTDE